MKAITNKRLYAIGVTAMLTSLACRHAQESKSMMNNGDVIPVKVETLQTENIKQVITVSGQFSTDDETILSFKNGGVIKKIYVKEGDAIRKGQLLAAVSENEISTQANQLKLAFQKAERDYNRAQKLFRDSVATLEQMQNAKTALDVAKQQLNAVNINVGYVEIRAQKNGYILRKIANEGQVVGPGTPVLQVNGAGQSNWILKAGLSDKQWAALKIGDRAEISTDALPGKIFNAILSRKAESIDPSNGTFGIELKVQDAAVKGLASGLFGKAKVFPTLSLTQYSIPYDALLDANENEGYIFITNDKRTAKKIKVSLGALQQNRVVITGGLGQAKAIIVSGSAYLEDNSKIKVLN
ncbi:efflux RND transporter periplasmic adaptor subunit [Pedobacter sp.]|uniref:efflux RND transporter periplasmic adaptor subunit n=1 Tax=Pedobacter sp. TaxID=1411316 RepID=UPI00396C2D6E